jgi:hypothetical protein
MRQGLARDHGVLTIRSPYCGPRHSGMGGSLPRRRPLGSQESRRAHRITGRAPAHHYGGQLP